MKKLFISQPMRDKTEDEILREREIAVAHAKDLLKEDVEIIDSYFGQDPNAMDAEDLNLPLWHLGKSLELLAEADIAYFARGWDKARGCIIEHDCALAYGISVVEDYM